MMNTKTKYSTNYSVTFWSGADERDSVVEDNLTEALRFVRDLWPDAVLNTTPEGIFATIKGETVAEVREHKPAPEVNESPVERDIRARLGQDRSRTGQVNARNEQHKRDIERAKLEMLDKGTLIDELIRWTAVAKQEREHKDQAEEVMNGQQEVINALTDTITEIKRNARAEVEKWKAEARRES